MPIDLVKPNPDNPREGHAVQAIARSLRELGWHAPIVVRRSTGLVTAGHGRLAAAHLLGLTEVPVLALEDDAAQAVARMVADNRTSELPVWYDMLGVPEYRCQAVEKERELARVVLNIKAQPDVKTAFAQALA